MPFNERIQPFTTTRKKAMNSTTNKPAAELNAPAVSSFTDILLKMAEVERVDDLSLIVMSKEAFLRLCNGESVETFSHIAFGEGTELPVELADLA
jgi:hypothetical protein